MALICEDLAQYGVVLVPPSADDYFELLADIEQRVQARPKGGPPLEMEATHEIFDQRGGGGAILLNRAEVAIAAIAYIWSFRTEDGRIEGHRFLPGTNPSVLLPYCQNERMAKFHAFWDTIFPGSKHLFTPDGRYYGDNTDVRAPAEDELWHGGFVVGRGSGTRQREPVKLTLDGVFFADGGFAGTNQLGAWEHAAFAVEAYFACTKLAREAREKGIGPSDFFDQLQEITGYPGEARRPPPPPPPSGPLDLNIIRKRELWQVASAVEWMRKSVGDEAAMLKTAVWSELPAPKLHKL